MSVARYRYRLRAASTLLGVRTRCCTLLCQSPIGAIIRLVLSVVLPMDQERGPPVLRQNSTNLVRIGILVLPLSGLLTLTGLLGSYGEPEARVDVEAAAQAASSTGYFISQLANIVSLTALIFGVMALAAYLANTRARVWALVAMVSSIAGIA